MKARINILLLRAVIYILEAQIKTINSELDNYIYEAVYQLECVVFRIELNLENKKL
ncbi:hypothetical protein MY04_4782 [Flammeovirga sp. MY04]|uniref:hypothetical protein n=1 Tax=Flammeovirga sp. MY04 TaxID=1191459 RepID=UPI0008061564|nr:hypothetical protein [Flammeovirga sp. MY04]ANQ49599.1 hypothetical protein MY04_2225 [Flammeovirga sp. MY04]ANQ52117.1 hypothetical protein MY04_4782 [Flammeovirga sp. MY04]